MSHVFFCVKLSLIVFTFSDDPSCIPSLDFSPSGTEDPLTSAADGASSSEGVSRLPNYVESMWSSISSSSHAVGTAVHDTITSKIPMLGTAGRLSTYSTRYHHISRILVLYLIPH